MKKTIFVLCISILIALSVQAQNYEASWESLKSRPYPEWFNDCKLGIFIHWGLYSVPSYSDKEQYAEWFMRGLELNDTLRINFQNRVYGPEFKYKDYAPLFKAELFDAAEWAKIFRESGAGYVLLVSKHHDGYCLWPSKHQPGWNTVDIGPERDIVGELTNAVRNEGMKMGLYYSLAEWDHPLHDWYDDDARTIGPYVEKYMIPQFKDLISTYKPSLVFTDGEWYNTADEWHTKELIAWYYNLVGKDAIVNDRWGHGNQVGFLTPEYSSGEIKTDRPWAELRGLGRSFGLNRNEKLEAYMSPEKLIRFFVNAVAHGGGVTINVGPKADGQIPLIQQERLKQLGNWLAVNGEAIYGSKKWERTHEERTVELKRIDPQINFNWVRNSPGEPIKEDQFSAEWVGYIQSDFSDEYLFEAVADNKVRVWINNKLLVDKWESKKSGSEGNVMSNDEAETIAGKIKLKKGKLYPIKISFQEEKQNASIVLHWSSEKQKKSIVPSKNLFTSKDKSINGLSCTYESKQTHICYTEKDGNVYATIFEWPGKELKLAVKDKNIKSIKLLGTNIGLEWSKTENGITIDLSEIFPNNLPCKYAWCFKIEL